jgi:hypothetical protein
MNVHIRLGVNIRVAQFHFFPRVCHSSVMDYYSMVLMMIWYHRSSHTSISLLLTCIPTRDKWLTVWSSIPAFSHLRVRSAVSSRVSLIINNKESRIINNNWYLPRFQFILVISLLSELAALHIGFDIMSPGCFKAIIYQVYTAFRLMDSNKGFILRSKYTMLYRR